MAQKTTYFPSLNGVRLIAASMVVIAHIEAFKNKSGFPSFADHPIINSLGPQGVAIFFVLSGFLITYLLLAEKNHYNKISLRKFYTRRILRIWPLYFVVLILGFFVLPHSGLGDFLVSTEEYFTLKLLLCIAILPNFVYNLFGHMLMIGPLWSVGAEEQFYLIWPNVINSLKKKIKVKPILFSYLTILSIKVLSHVIFKHNDSLEFSPLIFKTCKTLSYILKYDLMILGGFMAYFAYKKHKLLDIVYNKYWQLFCVLAVLACWFTKPALYGLEDTILGILYGSIITNLATNSGAIFKLENRFYNFGGQISYGIYMFHSLFIALGIKLFSTYLNNFMGNIFLYIFTFSGTILLAYLSYKYFEKPILHYKQKFMVVKSSMEKPN